MVWSGKNKNSGLDGLEGWRGSTSKGKALQAGAQCPGLQRKQVWLVSGKNCVEQARRVGQEWGVGLRKETGRSCSVEE